MAAGAGGIRGQHLGHSAGSINDTEPGQWPTTEQTTSLFSLFIIYPISQHKGKEMKIRITFLAFVLLKFGEGYLSWG